MSTLKRYIDHAIRREVRRYLDSPKEKLIRKINQELNNASAGLHEYKFLNSKRYNTSAVAAAEHNIDKIEKSILNGQLERADKQLYGVKQILKNGDAEDVMGTYGGSVFRIIDRVRNYINSLKNLR